MTRCFPYEGNPRNNDEAVDAVAASIKEFGFKVPIIVDGENVIVAGHTRLKAAEKLGLEKVPVIRADDLTEEQVKAFRLADNKTAEIAEWDFDKLETELAELAEMCVDMLDFGFNELEGSPPEIVEDNPPEVDEENEPFTKRGDVWKLGNHYLKCGDATNAKEVEKLLSAGESSPVRIDMVFTDPPYNINYQGINDKRTIKNDKMGNADFVDFIKAALPKCETIYVCCSWQNAHLFRKAIEENGNKIKAMIVWDKVNPAQHLDLYFKQHEIIFYCGNFGGCKTVRGDVWQIKRETNTSHPTMKPIKLIATALNDHPDKKVVFDGFGGSGSTLIAAEQTGHLCRMMEIDPHYCDVIIERWENFTGKKAEKIM